jgi:hypothetical protein
VLTQNKNETSKNSTRSYTITRDFSRPALNTRLKALVRKNPNTATAVDHILAEQMEGNINSSMAESKIKVLLWLSKYLNDKPFQKMTKQEILGYLNSLRKPTLLDHRKNNKYCRDPNIS